MIFILSLLSQLSICETGDVVYTESERINLTVDINEQNLFFNSLVTTANGGGIYIKDNGGLILNNCKFDSCKGNHGGAIYIYYTKSTVRAVEITNTIFSNCQSTKNGGALYLHALVDKLVTSKIDRCTFTSNKAGNNGGAIYAFVFEQLEITKCTFENNQVASKKYNGSSIYCHLGSHSNTTTLNKYTTITDCTFTFTPDTNNIINVYVRARDNQRKVPNSVVNMGGCHFTSTDVTATGFKHLVLDPMGVGFEKIDFTSCNCVQQKSDTISIQSKFSIKNFDFECASLDGCSFDAEIPGALEPQYPVDPVDPIDPIDPNDPAPDYDGYTKKERIEMSKNNEGLILEKCSFVTLSSTTEGGAIKCQKINVTINDCKFYGDKGTNGGALYIQLSGGTNQFFNITNSEFTKCIASKNGGAIYIYTTQLNIHSVYIDNCIFSSNQGAIGGAFYGDVRDEFTLTNCQFDNNLGTTSGSSLYVLAGNANGKDKNNAFILLDNVFNAHKSSSSNVHFINEKITVDILGHISINIGGCTFSATDPSNSEYKNLFLEESGTIFGYESVTFSKCNCFKQGSNSISVPSKFELNNIMVECTSIDKCVPGSVEQPTPETPELDTDGYYIGKRINDEGKAIDLKNYKFSVETENENGGAILINNKRVSCTLFNCTFNSCKGKNGGALYIYYAVTESLLKLLVSKCSFSNCVASNNGGAIYLETVRSRDYDLTISACTFTSNNAKNGGALYLLVRDNFTMNDCTFNNNVATSVGSSLWCKVGYNNGDTDNVVSFSSNTFAFNPTENSVNVYFENYNIDSTKNDLNAILSLGTSIFVANGNENVQFKHLQISKVGSGFQEIRIPECICIDKDNNAVSLPEGSSDTSITYNCGSLSSCKPDSDGYKYHEQIKDESSEPINLENYKFNNYNSEENGGAINIDSNKVSCTIKHCKFDSCKGTLGGAIHLFYTGKEGVYVCLIENTLFINNEAVTNGGAIHCQITQSNLHSITIKSCTFRSNKAKKDGGAVYALARDSFVMEHCVFEDNNIVDGQGCSFWLKLGSNTKYNYNAAVINDNSFTFTPKKKDSINVYIESSKLNEDVTPNANLTFGSNTFLSTSEIAGYKHVKVVASAEFEVLNFHKCNCVKEGSETVELPYSLDPELYFNFNCQSLDKCSITKRPTPTPAPDSDGFTPSQRIDLSQAPKLKLIKTKFNNIESESAGGAVSLIKTSCEFTDCRFTTCKTKVATKNGGGAINIEYSNKKEGPFSALIVNCIFTSCESTNHGGAINIANTQSGRHSVHIEGCTFTQNTATKNGGGINAFGRDLLTIQFCTFNNNIAAQGSSLWCQVGWELGVTGNKNILYSNTFTFQPSESNPTNVYITSYSLKAGNAENANVLIGNCQFAASNINGESQKHLIIKEVGKFQSIVFSECNCIQGAENTVSIESSIQPSYQKPLKYNCNNPNQCQADEQPPASEECSKYSSRQEIYGKELEIKNTCFNNLQSSSSRDGGAINAVNAKLELENCTFNKCKSESHGGAIYASFTITDCEFEIESCTFEDCVSLKYGGAVYFSNNYASESSIEKCKFINNKASSKGGALYYAPCANSKLLNCTFINNTCTAKYTYGSAVYLLARNLNAKNLRALDGTNVVIDGCVIKSQPIENDQQMYINLKKTGKVEFGSNSFSFNGATEIPQYAKYIEVAADEGVAVNVVGQTCIDMNDNSRQDLVSGINQNVNFKCEIPKDDDESQKPPPKKKSNTGLIVGCVVGALVVVAIIVVVVVIVVKRKNKNKYVDDLADDEMEAQSGITNTDAAESATNL